MSRIPQQVFENPEQNQPMVFAFPPNRQTLGGTAYLILENSGNVLVDCPAWNDQNQQFIADQGGVQQLCITHRGAIAQVQAIQQAYGCSVVIQEQEAYLLPDVQAVIPFHHEYAPTPQTMMIWTPGHSPGSACLYHNQGTLFSGRHLLPNPTGRLGPIQNRNTFHWPRQIRSIEMLFKRFTPETLHYICPGANLGFLRGKRYVGEGYPILRELKDSISDR